MPQCNVLPIPGWLVLLAVASASCMRPSRDPVRTGASGTATFELATTWLSQRADTRFRANRAGQHRDWSIGCGLVDASAVASDTKSIWCNPRPGDELGQCPSAHLDGPVLRFLGCHWPGSALSCSMICMVRRALPRHTLGTFHIATAHACEV